MLTEAELNQLNTVLKEKDKQIASLRTAMGVLERRLILIERRERSRDVLARTSQAKLNTLERRLLERESLLERLLERR